jgi:hypothetical protein
VLRSQTAKRLTGITVSILTPGDPAAPPVAAVLFLRRSLQLPLSALAAALLGYPKPLKPWKPLPRVAPKTGSDTVTPFPANVFCTSRSSSAACESILFCSRLSQGMYIKIPGAPRLPVGAVFLIDVTPAARRAARMKTKTAAGTFCVPFQPAPSMKKPSLVRSAYAVFPVASSCGLFIARYFRPARRGTAS